MSRLKNQPVNQPKKIKILYLIPTLDAGGAEFLLAQIAAGLNPKEFAVSIGCLKRIGPAGQAVPGYVKIDVICSNKKLTGRSFIKIYQFIKRQQPDIVHTHLWGADVLGILAARLAGVKAVVSTEHNLNYGESGLKKIAKIFAFKFSSKIIAVSRSVRQYCQRELKVAPKKIVTIYNGAEAKKFYFARPPRDFQAGRPIIIGAAGRLAEQKGFAVLIKALPYLAEYNFKVKIAGQGPLASGLKGLAQKLKVANKVEFVGAVNNMPDFYKSLDIFVLPSLWEGFGLVILEAGLAQLPVVASRVDGIEELVEDRRDGLLFAPGDSPDLARQLKFLFVNFEFGRQLGINLQAKVKQHFTLNKTVRQYEELYRLECQKLKIIKQ